MRGHLPNAISAIRGLLVVPVVLYIVAAGDERSVAASALVALAWMSDGLDGWLARRWSAESELGRVLDPVADKLVVLGTAAALWATGRMPGWLLVAIAARDVATLALAVPMWRRRGRVPQSNVVGKVTLGVLMVTLGACLLDLGPLVGPLGWISLAAVALSTVSYGRRFLSQMRVRNRSPAPIAQSG